MANMTEIDRVVAHIEALPEGRHDQGEWFDVDPGYEDAGDWQCHTTACLAGWTVALNGWRPTNPTSPGDLVTDGAAQRPIFDVASELLGLTVRQARDLFYLAADLDAVRSMVEAIRAGRS